MDPNSYYDDLMRQGYNSADASHFTQQYYPEFQSQGMAAMAPPPGGMEMGGMAAGGFGAPAGGMAAGGAVAAGGAAAAGGGMKIAIISVVSVLALGGAATGGYFLYDYLTEPDFYGEVYWSENGFAYIFEEDEVKIAVPQVDGDCELYEDDETAVKKSGDLCLLDFDQGKYSSEDKGDYYEICLDNGDDEECLDIYPLDQGIVMKDGKECNILVSDISAPTVLEGDSEEEYREYEEDMDEWVTDWMDIAEDIYDDDDAPKCNYALFDDSSLDGDSTGDGLDTFQFEGRDAAGTVTDDINTQDDLVYVKMTQGKDLSWSQVGISITVDDGLSYECGEAPEEGVAATTPCVYTTGEDKSWDTPFEMKISEGDEDLCKPTTGKEYCQILVTVTKIGVGGDDSNVLANEEAVAQ